MASRISIFIFLASSFIVSYVQGKAQIVAPYPLNLYPFEDEKSQVSCAVTDTTGAKPDRIEFLKQGQYGDMVKIPDQGPSGRIYYTNKTEDNGKKLITTLHFNKVEKNKDKGSYECTGYSSGSKDAYGFTVNVIEKSEIPTAKLQGDTVLIGETAQLYCNVTKLLQVSNTIKYMAWIRNSEVLGKSLYASLPLMITNAGAKDDGEYTCVGLISFRNGGLEMNITFGKATLKVKQEIVIDIDRNTTVVYGTANGNVTLECPVSGVSSEVTWWRVDEDGEETKLNMSQRFVSTRPCPTCPTLTIINLESSDQGKYVCKGNSVAGSGNHVFDLSVHPGRNGTNGENSKTPTPNKPTPKAGSISLNYCIQSTLLFLACLVTWLVY